jgi:hypothetical protein
LLLVLSVLACKRERKHEGTKGPSIESGVARVRANAASPSALGEPNKTQLERTAPQQFTLRVLSEFYTLKVHRLGDGTMLISYGLTLGRLQGDSLQWEPSLSRGLPQRWDPNVFPEIDELYGENLESTWLSLAPGCGTPPMASGYPVEYEFVRAGDRWKLVPMDQRHFWHGEHHYKVASVFSFKGTQHRLMTADNSSGWVDGKVEDEDIENVSHCLGTAYVVDEDWRVVHEPLLPKDLCALKVVADGERLALAGLDQNRRLVLELRAGAKMSRHSPKWPAGCHIATSAGLFSVDWSSTREADVSGSRRCPDRPEPIDTVALHFDGEHFVTRRRQMDTAGPPLPKLPSGTKLRIVAPEAYWSFESEGVAWVLAYTNDSPCLSYSIGSPRFLYSSSAGKRNDGPKSISAELRFIETCLPHAPSVAILASTKRKQPFTDDEIARVARSNRVPDDCPIIEIVTESQHALGIPVSGEQDGDCGRYVVAFRGRRFCVSLDSLADATKEPDSAQTERFTWRREPH